ncbi:calcium-binding protein [Nocardioides conyzicola]|uniref:Calcium-binding protein n=1 Tax=Nocardioides conyzicola TaxID=1651781 RepID=A0ABP8WMH1_9ACTN
MRHLTAATATLLLIGAGTAAVSPAYAAVATCRGQAATIVATADGENLQGSEDADVIVVGSFDQVHVDGNGGDDVICATAGHDAVLDGGPGSDVLEDLPSTRKVEDNERTTLRGGDAGDDQFIGGRDTQLSYGDSETGVAFDLVAGTVVHAGGTDTVDGIRWLSGSAHPDTFRGSSGPDLYRAGPGDQVAMGAGVDFVDSYGATVDLGSGDDSGSVTGGTMDGGDGADVISVNQGGTADGGAGRDVVAGFVDVDELSGRGPILLRGGPGNDVLWPPVAYSTDASSGDDLGDCPGFCARGALDGGSGTDRLDVAGAGSSVVDLRSGRVRFVGGRSSITAVENVRGSKRRDIIRGDGHANRFDGYGGDDLLVGRGGPDRLLGGAGRDRAVGGPGHDHCVAERKSSC